VRSRFREMYVASEGRAAPLYGLMTAVGVTTPLIIGVLTGHAAESVLVGLGAFYVASAGPTGPYGARARSMLAAVAVVTVFTWFGGLFSGEPWLATAIIPVVAAIGAAIPWMGPTAALSTLIAAVRPPTSPVVFNGVLEMFGGLWITGLMLAPWITHRLRPLRTSVAEAARAVAEALDVLPDPDSGEWDRRRRQAYDALRQARATYVLYRGGGREEQRRPQRLVEALDRAMDEAVALRSLLTALRRELPPQQWEQECWAVVTALADRLRGLADAIEGSGGILPGHGPVALDRFVRVSDDVRREWLEGRSDVVGTALILQVRRLIGRINATIDGAAQIVSCGLKVGFGTPLTMLLIDFTEPLGWKAAAWRIALTVAGGAIALAAARILWPAGTLNLLPARLVRLLHTHAEMARAVAALFDGDTDAPVHRRLREASAAAVDVEESLTRLTQEPAPAEELLRRLRDAVTIARRLRDYLGTLAALAGERPVDAGPIPAILERVADHLDAAADDLQTGGLDLDDLLRELDDHLAELNRQRRAELVGGVGTDARTPLREALVEVAGARHALRALAEDADRLTEEGRALTA
jgi:FUSC-like inner membrane protein yccS